MAKENAAKAAEQAPETPKKKQGVVRKSDSRPAEVASSQPISLAQVKKATPLRRDPRFSEHSGVFDANKFSQAYNWMDSKLSKELKEAQDEINECEDQEKKRTMVEAVKKQRSILMSRQRSTFRQEVKRKLKTVQKDAVQRGQQHYFYNDQQVEKIAKEEFTKQLKAARLSKYLINKRTKAASKKAAPTPRRLPP